MSDFTVTATYSGERVYVTTETQFPSMATRLSLSVAMQPLSERAAQRVAAKADNDPSLTNVRVEPTSSNH